VDRNIDDVWKEFSQSLSSIQSEKDLEDLRVAWIGRKGCIAALMARLRDLDGDAKKLYGASVNKLRSDVSDAIGDSKKKLARRVLDEKLQTERVDITLPSRPELCDTGGVHPVSGVIEEIIDIFSALGFSVCEGPEIETEYYNFDALNISPDHPSRQMHDTFFMQQDDVADSSAPRLVLRTHTSPVQIRTMSSVAPPLRFISPGKVYRCDSDITHTPMFHQCEGVVIEKGITMAHLKWVLEEFCRVFFEKDNLEIRFRASYFPFTEPSAEVDVRCSWDNERLTIGTGESWLEILGCGMLHPNVLRGCSIDPDEWPGFAFGVGIDRLAMLKYAITDLRTFFSGDMRWLRAYNFPSFGRG
jgi:phenylalanyl-tRNA synthetase alpha chain